MDLSFNKLNKINQQSLSFQGVKGDYDMKSELVYKFTAPPYNPNKEQVFLQVVPLTENHKTGGYVEPEEGELRDIKFGENGFLELTQEEVDAMSSNAFAYRYKIVNTSTGAAQFRTDGFKSINIKDSNRKMNVLNHKRGYAITPKAGLMRHSFLDSDVILDSKNQMLTQDKDFVRNHFNKLGGNIKGLTYLLKNTNELNPYRYIMTTPDIGVDDVSSHKYWPNNQYQCSDIDNFKEFNFELFKRGKGYITDGAFASQGLQSPMVQHVLKWGEESPFFDMLKIEDDLRLGILPNLSSNDYDDAMAHIGVRLVNSPKGKNYNKDKATYIQLFDDRLTSKELLYSNELIKTYDKNPDDHYEITNHMDSVQPFYFELPADSEKIDAFKNSNVLMLNDLPDYEDFLKFKNFSIAKKSEVANASFWDGNTDIVKMNFSYGETPEKAAAIDDAREYILGVATFWTEAVQSDLILNVAKLSDSERKSIAQNNDLSKEQFENIKANSSTMNSLVVQQNKKIDDYVQSFPYQSIETSPEVSAIFAQPQFNKELYEGGFDEKIDTIVENVINEAIPKEYQNNKYYKAYVTKVYANTIIKTLFAGSLEPNSIEKDGKINTSILRKVDLKSMLPSKVASVDAERAAVVDYIKSSLDETVLENLKKEMKKELKGISLKDFSFAEQLVIQAKGGLNWRFDAAKDIGNLDSIRAGKKSFEEIWDEKKGVEAFWGDFITKIRTYNPSSYVINEITSFDDFEVWDSKGLYNSFDSNLTKEFYDKLAKDAENIGNYEERAIYAKEMEYLAKTASTTDSNYGKYFSTLAAFMGLDLEQGYLRSHNEIGNIGSLKEATERFMQYGHPNTVILSHVFFENHDKPRALHLMPLNSQLFFEKSLVNSEYSIVAGILFPEYKFDYNKISPKGLAVAQAMLNTLDKLPYKKEQKASLKHAIALLMQGKKDDDSRGSFRRSQAFGVLPYEVTIRDVFEKSGIQYSDKDVLNFHYTMMKSSMEKQDRLWQTTCALLGVPTLYGGMEFAQTGFETPSKNIHVGNRNQILHELKNEKGYKEYYDKIQATSSLCKDPSLSALKNGFPVIMPIQTVGKKIQFGGDFNEYIVNQLGEYFTGHDVKETFAKIREMKNSHKNEDLHDFLEFGLFINRDNGNHNKLIDNLDFYESYFEDANKSSISLWPLYRYDEFGSKTISVLSNYGINNAIKDLEVDSIQIKESKTFRSVLPEGTILKRKIYADGKYKDDGINYVVKDGAITSPKGKIKIVDTVSTFYVPKTGI